MENQSIAEKKFHIPFIDGLRGIAILAVLMVHTAQHVITGQTSSNFRFPIFDSFVKAGARGVQLFFIISAFTLFTSSLARYRTDAYPKIDFYLRRAFRILPFWFLMVIYMAFITGAIYDIKRVIINMTFIFGFLRFKPDVEVGLPGWSLFVEETFYIMLPFLFLYIKDIYHSFKLFLITLGLAVLWASAAPKIGVSNGAGGEFIFLFPFSHWFAFAIGITLYFLISNNNFKSVVLNVPANYLLLDTTALIAVFFSVIGANASFFGYIITTFSLVFVFIASVPGKTILGRITRNKFLMRFGIYCYSIYLFHMPLLDALDPLKALIFNGIGITHSMAEVKLFVWFPIVALISLCLAFLTFNLIEKPCVNLGKKLIPKINAMISTRFNGKAV